jgi:hypothetical protein
MSELGVERFSWREFYKEGERVILIAFSVVAFVAIVILRAFPHVDLICSCAVVAIALGWLYVALTRKPVRFAGNYYLREARLASTRVLGLVSVAALCSFFAASSTFDGLIVSGSQHKSTLTQPVLFFVPIFNDISSVPLDFSQAVEDIPIATSDGIRLTCAVHTFGMVLDTRDPASLEALLLSEGMRSNPRASITARLQHVLREATAAVFNGKTSAEIADLGNRFAIPYGIGTLLGTALAADGLRWQDGSVSYSCSVVFNS